MTGLMALLAAPSAASFWFAIVVLARAHFDYGCVPASLKRRVVFMGLVSVLGLLAAVAAVPPWKAQWLLQGRESAFVSFAPWSRAVVVYVVGIGVANVVGGPVGLAVAMKWGRLSCDGVRKVEQREVRLPET